MRDMSTVIGRLLQFADDEPDHELAQDLRALVAENQDQHALIADQAESIKHYRDALTGAPDLARYLIGVHRETLGLWCTDCTDPTNPLSPAPIWREDELPLQAVNLRVAHFVAVCVQHDREHHCADAPEPGTDDPQAAAAAVCKATAEWVADRGARIEQDTP